MIERSYDPKRIVLSMSVMILYCALTTIVLGLLYAQGSVILKADISLATLPKRALQDFLLCVFIPASLVGVLYVKRGNLAFFGITVASPKAIIALAITYITIFILFGGITLVAMYFWMYYLVGIALPEEIIFRGIGFFGLYAGFNRTRSGAAIAVVVSGSIWGAMHAIVPAILGDNLFVKIVFSYIGGGILGSALYSYALVKSRSLLVPILLHASLDYLSMVLSH